MGYRYFEQAAHAAAYNKFRPSTPKQMIEKIVKYIQEQLPGPLNEALDIGCGSGQSTEVLAPYFRKVTGSDPSETQIIEAQKKNTVPNVYYKTKLSLIDTSHDDVRDLLTYMKNHTLEEDWFVAVPPTFTPDLWDVYDELAGGQRKVECETIKKRYFLNQGQIEIIVDKYQEFNDNNNFDLYVVGPAEKIDSPDESVQLITACQSCHWFDLPKFYSEAERILVPGGVLAMYGYVLPRPQYENKSEELSEIVDKYYNIVLGKYVLPQSKKAYLENYSTKDFNEIPFVSSPVVRDESIYIERKATLADLIGYMSSWSTFQNFRKQEGEERASCVLQDLEKELLDMTAPSKKPQDIQIIIIYKYFLLMARKPLKKIGGSLQ